MDLLNLPGMVSVGASIISDEHKNMQQQWAESTEYILYH